MWKFVILALLFGVEVCWSAGVKTSQRYTEKCPALPDIPNAIPLETHEADDDFFEGHSLFYACRIGFKSSFPIHRVKCAKSEQGELYWDTSRVKCTAPDTKARVKAQVVHSDEQREKTCFFDEREDRFKAYDGNRRVKPFEDVPSGTTLKFHCDPPGLLKLQGTSQATCRDGRWSETPPYCVDLEPSDIRILVKEPVTYTTAPDGQIIVNPGSRLKMDCGTVDRKTETHWDYVLGNVNASHEIGLDIKDTGRYFTPLYKRYKKTLTAEIPENYNGTFTCRTDSGRSVTIGIIGRFLNSCPPITPPAGMDVSYGPHGDTRFSCRAPYVRKGPDVVLCQPFSEWEVPLPECVLEDPTNCAFNMFENRPGVQHMKENRLYRDGERLLYDCAEGYNKTNSSVTCLNGTWTSEDLRLCVDKGGLDGRLLPPATPTPSAPCLIDEREDRFHAYMGNKRVYPSEHVPDGTTVQFHCHPPGLLKVHGSKESSCDNGRWTKALPFCFELEDHDIRINIKEPSSYVTASGGVIVLRPGSTLTMDCSRLDRKVDVTWKYNTSVGVAIDVADTGRSFTKLYRRYKKTVSAVVPDGFRGTFTCSWAPGLDKTIEVVSRHYYSCPTIKPSPGLIIDAETSNELSFSCDPNHALVGPEVIHCQAFSEWDQVPPHCELQGPPVCLQKYLPRSSGAVLQPREEPYEDKEVLRYVCEEGFVRNEILLHCNNGSWAPENVQLCYKAVCDMDPPSIENAFFDLPGEEILRHGQTVAYHCNPGYIQQNEHSVQCWDGSYIGTLPRCMEIKYAPAPSSRSQVSITEPQESCVFITRDMKLRAFDDNKRVKIFRSVPHGTQLTFHCNSVGRHKLEGVNQTICNNGRWTSPIPSCREISYGEPRITIKEPVPHGIAPGGVLVVPPLSNVTMECHTGGMTGRPEWRYSTSNNDYVQVLETGTSFPADSNGHKQVLTLTVPEEGYSETFACGTPGQTAQLPIRSHRIYDCPALQRTEGLIVEHATHGEAKISCKPSYILQGPDLLRCQSFGEWDLAPPRCVSLGRTSGHRCSSDSLRSETGVRYLSNKPAYAHRQKVDYECPSWRVKTNANVTCNNGTWIYDHEQLCIDDTEPQGQEVQQSQDRFPEDIDLDFQQQGQGHITFPIVDITSPVPRQRELTTPEPTPTPSPITRPCTFGDREDRFKAYIGNTRVWPFQDIPHGSTVRFHCEPVGTLMLKGPSQITCNDGTWSEEPPFCFEISDDKEIVLTLPDDIDFVTGPGGSIYVQPGEKMDIFCHTYDKMERPEWNYWAAPASRELKIITEPAQVDRDLYASKLSFKVPSDFAGVFTCFVAGGRNLSLEIYSKTLRTCEPLRTGPHLKIEGLGSVVTLDCLPPYKLEGSHVLACLPFGEWDHPLPECRLPDSYNGPNCSVADFYSRVREGVTAPFVAPVLPAGTSLRAECDSEGYVLIANSTSVECSANGTWLLDDSMHCTIGCRPLQIPEGSLLNVQNVKETYELGETVTFSCPEGTEMVPPVATVACTGGFWYKPEIPECLPLPTTTTFPSLPHMFEREIKKTGSSVKGSSIKGIKEGPIH